MDTPIVTVGIVTWNSSQDLPSCLDALSRQTYPHLEMVLVDNFSIDESISVFTKRFPNATIIRNYMNRGFCAAHNQAISSSNSRFYLPLNPDVILEREYIDAAVDAMETNLSIGLVATRLLLGPKENSPHQFDSTGLFIDRRRRQYLRGFGQAVQEQYNRKEEVFGVDGAAPLYRREMLEDIRIDKQYFDESFFSHKEDVDLSWRARLLGWKCIYTPDAVGYHKRTFKPGNRKSINNEIKLHAVKNRYLLMLKNESRAGWRRDWVQILSYDLKILMYLVLFERSSLRAFHLINNNWRRTLTWRKEIANRSKVPPEELLRWFT